MSHHILLPSKPRIVSEEDTKGVYEIDNLYPGYGFTLGNSLRRIILSSLPGSAITHIKIEGAEHEFSAIDGVKEDVIAIMLNLKKVRFNLLTDEPQTVNLEVKGAKVVTAGMIKASGQVEILNPDQYIAEVTDKNSTLKIEIRIEKGLGFVSKDVLNKEKVEIGNIALDAIFSPIRRVAYEVEDMRVGDKTNHNRLRILIETDGSISPKDALQKSIEIMILQLKAIFGFKEPEPVALDQAEEDVASDDSVSSENEEDMTDVLKTRIDTLDFSTRTLNALTSANVRTIGGLAKKKTEDLLEIEGIGDKGIKEIKKVLNDFGINLK